MHLTINLDKSKQSPAAFLWQERLHRITGILERWRTVGAWWDGEGERTIFRVTVENGGIFEIAYEHGDGSWNMVRIED